MKNPNNQVHIAQTLLDDFAAGLLKYDEMITAMEHIEGCEKCALALTEVIETKQPALAPAGFYEEVLRKITHLKENKKELLHYSFRVAIAACAALFLIFSGALNILTKPRSSIEKIESLDFSVVDNINTQLQYFSQQILDMEVFINDEETK